jgi:hypothetical protein
MTEKVYVCRDDLGEITGVFANPQPHLVPSAEEELDEDDPEVVEFHQKRATLGPSPTNA